MRKRFELIAGTSKKFWEVETVGKAMTVRFGRIGTDGQTKTKRFSTPLSAERAANALVFEKRRKGYAPVGAARPKGSTTPIVRGAEPVKVGRSVRHPIDGFRLSPLVARVAALAEPLRYLELDWTLGLVRAKKGDLVDARAQLGRSFYRNHPFELSTFSSNGGDGLEYAWAVHAPELDLDDQPMVSWAPVDDRGARFLGRDTPEGITNLVIAEYKSWQRHRHRDDEDGPLLERRAWRAAVKLLPRAPDLRARHVNHGARIAKPLVPRVPKGWHFEPGPDGVGVLAPEDLFGSRRLVSSMKRAPLERARAAAEQLASAGAHAGALAVWKVLRRTQGDAPFAVRGMRDAYRALGREMHAQRADLWLEHYE